MALVNLILNQSPFIFGFYIDKMIKSTILTLRPLSNRVKPFGIDLSETDSFSFGRGEPVSLKSYRLPEGLEHRSFKPTAYSSTSRALRSQSLQESKSSGSKISLTTWLKSEPLIR